MPLLGCLIEAIHRFSTSFRILHIIGNCELRIERQRRDHRPFQKSLPKSNHVHVDTLLFGHTERNPFERNAPITHHHQHILQCFNIGKRICGHKNQVSLVTCDEPSRLIL